MKEIWKEVKGYEGLYKISNFGEIWCIKPRKGRRIGTSPNRKNYLVANLSKDGVTKCKGVHIWVAENFLDKNDFKCAPYEKRDEVDLSKLVVNHIDENKQNNRVDNLEWCTQAYNSIWSGAKVNRYRNRYKPVIQVDLEHNIIKEWKCGVKEIYEETGIPRAYLYDCCNKKRKTAGGFKWFYKEDL